MQTIVYKYGLLPPRENAALVEDQIRLAHHYRNDLTHLERARRAAVRQVLGEHDGVAQIDKKLAEAKAVLERSLRAVSEHKAANRTRKVPQELAASVAQAKASLRELRAARRLALKDAREAVAPVLKQIEERHLLMHKSARAQCGVYWGTYLLVEDAMNLVRKMPLFDAFGEPNDPRFSRWSGGAGLVGLVGVQLPHGIEVRELTEDRRVQLLPGQPKKNADPNSKRSLKNRPMLLRMRVGSGEGRNPIWASWPMIYSRPLPENARIQRVSVSRRYVGPRGEQGSKEEWTVQFTVQVPERYLRRGKGSVAVDLGWRSEENGDLRVGTWQGDDEQDGIIVANKNVLDRIAHVRSLESIRDLSFGEIVGSLVKYREHLKTTASLDAHWEHWFLDQTQHLYQWKSKERLHRFIEQWMRRRHALDRVPVPLALTPRFSEHLAHWVKNLPLRDDLPPELRAELFEITNEDRAPGAETALPYRAFSTAWAWRCQDRHLWAWAAAELKKAVRQRQDAFRVAAARLAAKYDTLVLEDLNLREMAETPAPETGEVNSAPELRQLAAPGELRAALINAFGSGRVKLVAPERTTKICSWCDTENTVGPAPMHTCTGCGRIWHQDVNACRNLLRWQDGERPGDTKPAEAPGKVRPNEVQRGGRWAAAKAQKEETALRARKGA